MGTLFGFFLGSPGIGEMLLIGAVAVLLFGKRLPEVGRSLGRGLVEFKKGLRDIEEQIHSSSSESESHRVEHETDYEEPMAPRFEPPRSEPRNENDEAKHDVGR
ncbi:MAG: twin-arginine translocase TatA/TatE family subunit [Pirellulales bacterium]|nr:twin-arginine translocase TatA/TatE family subunit [Pirellulales bacterium]